MQLSTLQYASLLATLTTLVSATCYPKGYRFGELGGNFSPTADMPAVVDAIGRFCSRVNGTPYYRGTPSWKACVDMPPVTAERTKGNSPDCGKSCIESCMRMGGAGGGGDPFTPATQGDCRSGCNTKCGALVGSVNHVEFEISHDNPEHDEYWATFESCKDALYREIAGCKEGSGSYASYQGFWYRIDPNPGSCGGGKGEVL